MKFIFALFVALCVGIIANGESSGKCGDNLSWNFNEETSTLTISGTGAMSCASESTSPWRDLAEDILTVNIQDGVTTIGDYAFFGSKALLAVNTPSNLVSIGSFAFSKCKNLTTITVPSTVTSIGADAFSECESLLSVTVPRGVTEIANYTFYRCISMKTVDIQSELKSIGIHAFRDCSNLTSINIPSTVTSIGTCAFEHCESLKSFTIPAGVTKIDDQCFNGCYNLTSIDIPSSVTSIGLAAFYSCSSLKSITIPDSVTFFDSHVFAQCKSLESVTLPAAITAIGSHTFYECSSLKTVNVSPDLTSIANYAFLGCTSLETITIPSHVTSIEKEAFHDCSNLKSVVYLGSSDPKNGGDIFKGCDNLKLVCLQPSYTSASFCGLNQICKHESCESFLYNGCYEPVCNGGVIEMEKRDNATKWEKKSNGCYQYQCTKDDGPIYWKECNSTEDTQRTCENEKCIDVVPEKEEKFVVKINVEGMDIANMDLEEIQETIYNMTNVEAGKLRIRTDVNEKDEVVHILIIVDDEATADAVRDSLNKAIKEHSEDEVIKHFKSAEVVKIEPDNSSSSSAMIIKGKIIMVMLALLFTIFW